MSDVDCLTLREKLDIGYIKWTNLHAVGVFSCAMNIINVYNIITISKKFFLSPPHPLYLSTSHLTSLVTYVVYVFGHEKSTLSMARTHRTVVLVISYHSNHRHIVIIHVIIIYYNYECHPIRLLSAASRR